MKNDSKSGAKQDQTDYDKSVDVVVKDKSLSKTLEFLYGLQFTGIKLGLHNIKNLLKDYDVDYKSLKIIHIAGTNGKGSTSNILKSVFQSAGYKAGLFTSPHLVKFNERIRINDEMISDSDLEELTEFFREGIIRHNCTFFEATTAIALKYYIDNKTDIAIIETGLGGRLDSTNVVTPVISVITGIDYDHTSYLGNSLIEIAKEKGGIIKPGIPVVINEKRKFVSKKLAQIAKKNGSDCYFASKEIRLSGIKTLKKGKKIEFLFNGEKIRTYFNLEGKYQLINLKTALTVLKYLNKRTTIAVSVNDVKKGLSDVVVSGRMEVVSNDPYILIDAAHNSQGLRKIRDELKEFKYNNLHLVAGTVNDKDYREFVRIMLDFDGRKYFVQPKIKRGLEIGKIAAYLKGKKLSDNQKNYSLYNSVTDGMNEALKNYNQGDLIFVTGSHFVLGDFLETIEKR
jgi:dihydrofolate synthase/folylpolyglutamate synthase